MSWNLRVFAEDYDGEVWLDVYEVHHDSNGNIIGYTASPITIGGESTEAIRWQLDRIRDCLDKPILDKNNFPDATIFL